MVVACSPISFALIGRLPASLGIASVLVASLATASATAASFQNCRRAVFKAKLADLEERFGIVAHEVPSPYTSQECSSCGYVDRRNRRSQSEFLCRFCGMQKHADVNAACTVKGRRSSGLADKFLTKGAILTPVDTSAWREVPTVTGSGRRPAVDQSLLVSCGEECADTRLGVLCSKAINPTADFPSDLACFTWRACYNSDPGRLSWR
jgi:hypothetical protein